MSSMPPFIAQERPDTFAVACLRMLLAARGILASEQELVALTKLVEGGLTPEELAALARHKSLPASERQINETEVAALVRGGRYPIVYLYRKLLDGVSSVHAVIPVRFSKHFVTLLDPLRGRRRVSRKKLAKARAMVQDWAVILAD
jgi:ABC-type bacteriocin/lantibiotic exporter with double-glycine peptidase domain